MDLSDRTQNFIKRYKVKSVVNDQNEIIKIFQEANLPIFEPVINFQERFAGIILHAGLAPIIFGIIPTDKPEDPHFTEIEAELCADKWRFICADTLYQMGFEIDESGEILKMMYWLPNRQTTTLHVSLLKKK